MVDTFHPRYTYTKRGVYYFCKTVPVDLDKYYKKDRIIQSLRTKSRGKAEQISRRLLSRLEDYWLNLRLREADIPAGHLLKCVPSQNSDSLLPTIEDALQLYLSMKGEGRPKTFHTHSQRSVGYIIQCLGARSLDQYSSADAAEFRGWLRKRGLSTASIQRNFSNVKAVVNFCILERGLGCINAFAGVYLRQDLVAQKRKAVALDDIRIIQNKCFEINDDVRWLVALISDTGMRLAEAAGLELNDIKLDHMHPHVCVRPNSVRTLKTQSSERIIPLVGAALWATKKIVASNCGTHCFPRYTEEGRCKSNSASAAINKWLKKVASPIVTLHGFRHSFRDRLREVEAPLEIIDQLGGWSLKSVGQSYGNGYSLKAKNKWMDLIAS